MSQNTMTVKGIQISGPADQMMQDGDPHPLTSTHFHSFPALPTLPTSDLWKCPWFPPTILPLTYLILVFK